jgi:phytoene dehydrogenase-like protein
LSVIDPTQAPTGKHTTYCWHVMPFEPDLGGQNEGDFKREFADKIVETFARYCPNSDSHRNPDSGRRPSRRRQQ